MGSDDIARKEAGRLGEQVACDFLIGRGFRILTRNYRKPWGEIDIIAEKNNVIRFVEVKTLTHNYPASAVSRERDGYRPEEQVHPWKLEKLARTAELYMAAKKDGREYQIDVVGVLLDMERRKARCRLFEQVL